MQVGIRELKAHLSEYLKRAERGEVITVTERGNAKAVLGPLPGRLRLEEGLAEGWITPARAKGLTPVRRHKSDRRSGDVLDEDRGG